MNEEEEEANVMSLSQAKGMRSTSQTKIFPISGVDEQIPRFIMTVPEIKLVHCFGAKMKWVFAFADFRPTRLRCEKGSLRLYVHNADLVPFNGISMVWPSHYNGNQAVTSHCFLFYLGNFFF